MRQLTIQFNVELPGGDQADDGPGRRRSAAADALARGAAVVQALCIVHEGGVDAPADEVVALARRVASMLPARRRRRILERLCVSTCVVAGRTVLRDGGALARLGDVLEAHRDELALALDERDAAKPAADLLVAVRDCYGRMHRVLRADLDDAAVTLLPRYRRNGQPIDDIAGRLHRDNIDRDGSKAAAAWSDLPYIAGRGDRPFRSERSAVAAIRRLGQDPARYALAHVDGGVVAVRGKDADDPGPADADAGGGNGAARKREARPTANHRAGMGKRGHQAPPALEDVDGA